MHSKDYDLMLGNKLTVGFQTLLILAGMISNYCWKDSCSLYHLDSLVTR